MRIHFTIEGEPKGKGRPRFRRIGNYVSTYTPATTASYEDAVRLAYKQAAQGAYFEGPVKMEVWCIFGIPKSATKKNQAEMLSGKVLPTKKPDADNVLKIIADALNGLAYKDDTQITDMEIHRRYAAIPYVEVILEERKE